MPRSSASLRFVRSAIDCTRLLKHAAYGGLGGVRLEPTNWVSGGFNTHESERGRRLISATSSGALISAELGLPFDQIAPRLAPWRVLEAARSQGSDSAEVRFAADIISHVLADEKIEVP